MALTSCRAFPEVECPWLYGIHDHDPQPTEYLQHIKNVVPRGWVTATVAIGHDPSDTSGGDFSWYEHNGYTVICRLNNGYFPNGTIPTPDYYADFAIRCRNYVANSTGCHIWIIGNEINVWGEWPALGTRCWYVSPTDYAYCYRQSYDAIKTVRPNDKVLSCALAPFTGPFKAGYQAPYNYDANPLSWVDYMNQMLTAIKNSGGIDGIALHVNSRGYTYGNIHSVTQQDVSGKMLYLSFYVYKDWVNYGIPSSLYHLPVYITECNGYYFWKGGHPENPIPHYEPGWVQEVYKEIDSYNRTVAVPQGKPVFHCLNFYRWCAWCDGWNIDGDNPYKGQILSDLDAALAFQYTWPGAVINPEAWSDDFNDGSLDTNAPEPDWTAFTADGGIVEEADGHLKLRGTSGSPSTARVGNPDWPVYKDFTIETKLNLADVAGTVGDESNVEVRFRADSSAVGYSLSFRAVENLITLRRSDTGQVIQGKEVAYSLPNGTVLYVQVHCDVTRIRIQVGSTQGAADIIDWDFTDTTFAGKGCFWLVNHHMMDARFDFFNYQPLPSGIGGMVRDSLGNPLSGAQVTTSAGGYSATSGADGAYRFNAANGSYYVTASKANYQPQTVQNVFVNVGVTPVDFTIIDATVPSTPVVSDAGLYQTSADSITFSWLPCSDPESGISQYRYAISTTTSMVNIIPGGQWETTGLATSGTRTGLSLANGQTYYGLVRAINGINRASAIGVSDGVKVAKGVSSIALAKAEPDGRMVALDDRLVTASFSDHIYIEDPARTSGVKVMVSGLGEGRVVDLAGFLSTVNGERQISGYAVIQGDLVQPPRPLGLWNECVGGGPLNAYTPGVTGGFGVNNIGLLITTWGRVLDKQTGYFIISDDGLTSLKVSVPGAVSIPDEGTLVQVTGISSVESGSRLLRIRKPSDLKPLP